MGESEFSWHFCIQWRCWAVGLAWADGGNILLAFGPLLLERTDDFQCAGDEERQ
jgi:hypothetical protein